MQGSELSSLGAAVRRVCEQDLPDPETDDLIPLSDNQWPLSRPTARLVARLVRDLGLRRVLEFGAGRSSVVLATAISRHGGGCLTSVEHQPEFARESWRQVEAMSSIDSQLVVSRLTLGLSRYGLMYTFSEATKALARRAPYDMLLIDSPPGAYGRDSTLFQAYRYLQPGAVIVLDDANRSGEQTAARRWLRACPGLQQCVEDPDRGRGVAVFVHTGDKRQPFIPRVFFGTLHDRLRLNRTEAAC
jgi:predicted O-methyltransferase YrrM